LIRFLLRYTGISLAIALVSTFSATRLVRSPAWIREWDTVNGQEGLGLTLEIVFVLLLAASFMTICLIMRDAVRRILDERIYARRWFVSLTAVTVLGVVGYTTLAAPGILQSLQDVPAERVWRECRLPYFAYTPYSLVNWVAFVLPMVLVIGVSIHDDRKALMSFATRLGSASANVVGHVRCSVEEDGTEDCEARIELYRYEYHEKAEVITEMVGKLIWVVGIFIVFVIVMLNTHLSSIYTETAKDIFKLVMLLLLAVALFVGYLGILRFLGFRNEVLASLGDIYDIAEEADQAKLMLFARSVMREISPEGTIYFVKKLLSGGSLWLLFFTYSYQLIIAKATERSVVDTVLPSYVVAFLKKIMITGSSMGS